MYKIVFLISLWLSACYVPPELLAQIQLQVVAQSEASPFKALSYQKNHKDSLSAFAEIQNLQLRYQDIGYLLAKIKKIHYDSTKQQLHAVLATGQAFQWVALRRGNLPAEVLQKVHFKDKIYQQTAFRYRQVIALKREVLTYSENHGYPFASLMLDSIHIEGHHLKASLNYKSGTFIRFDTLLIEGKAGVRTDFLQRYLRLKKGEPFSQAKVEQALRLLSTLPYIRESKPADLIFKDDRAYLKLYLEKRKTDEADLLVGLMPNEEQENRMLLTGQLLLRFHNPFGGGKLIHIEGQRIRSETQRLRLEYKHPNLFNTGFDVGGDFFMLKEDTTFLRLERNLTMRYPSKYGEIRFMIGLETTRLLAAPRDFRHIDSDYLHYGIGYRRLALDDILLPRKGWLIDLQIQTGNKRILTNTLIPEAVYDTLALKSTQFRLLAELEYFIKTGNLTTLYLRNRAGIIVNENLFRNDLFTIGGLKTLRGFNENFFFVSDYNILTAEFRLHFEENSFLFVFADAAWVRSRASGSAFSDLPYGLGAGLSFSTQAGIFTFVYALGGQQEQPINLRLSKIHFGLVGRF
ncbi:MAG: BamA/TamA family outer membrane protein [Bernardetiaceae bacterium]|nr:BamA/TamA family outer membrane protein [Bernardetiaceae bacterium]